MSSVFVERRILFSSNSSGAETIRTALPIQYVPQSVPVLVLVVYRTVSLVPN